MSDWLLAGTPTTLSDPDFVPYEYFDVLGVRNADAYTGRMGTNADSPDVFAAMRIDLTAGGAIDQSNVAGGI